MHVTNKQFFCFVLVIISEHQNVKIVLEDGIIKLKRYNYYGVDIALFGSKVVYQDKLYDGLEVSVIGDPRDAVESLFDAKLVTPNILLLKIPSSNRGMQDNHEQCLQNYDNKNIAFDAIARGHHLVRADRSEHEILRIRFVALTFPMFYSLSNEIFSPNAASGHQASSKVNYIVTGYSYEHQETIVKCGLIRATWLFNKYVINAPRLTIKTNHEDEAVAAMNETFRGMKT
jgi:hypothetical protein